MAVTFTRNLKLRIDSNLTANAKYNLERIDLLGSTFLVDSTDALNVRSRTDINIEPESADIDGSGSGGVVNIGNSSHEITSLNVYSTDVNFSDTIGLKDQATSGTRYLRLKYKTDLNNSLDTTADRTLSVDLDGANRELVLGGNLTLTGGNLVMTLTGNSSVTLPLTGTLATLAGAETLTNKVIDADSNTISNIRNANVAANAAIAYSKLALTNSIVNADVASGAAIVYSKLSLSDSITNADINSAAAIAYSKLNLATSVVNADISPSAAIAYSKLALTGTILNADINGAAGITYSKLNLTGGILNADVNSAAGITYSKLALTNSLVNADVNSAAAIAYSKLNLAGSITNADIAADAAIDASKISGDFGAGDIITSGELRISNGSFYSALLAQASQSANITYQLPDTAPTGDQVLRANTSDPTILEWATLAGSGTVTSVAMSVPSFLSVAGSPITSNGTFAVSLATQAANRIFAGPATGADATPTFRALALADLPANIDHGGLAGLADDDHTQYHTDARALTWLGTRSTSDLPEGSRLYYTQTRFDTAFAAKSTSDLSEGSNLYFTNERVDDRVDALIQDGIGLTWTYDDTGNTLTGDVDLGDFDTADLVEGSNLYFTDERAQDAIGTILVDTATINFTYNDGTPSIVADVLPGGVDHDALLNFVANEHVDHSSVQIATSSTSGLSGGGDITTTRNLLVAPDQATAKATPVGADILLIADTEAANALKKITITSLLSLGGGSFAADWTSLTTKTITHNLGSRDVLVQLYDNTTFETVYVDSVIRTDANTIDLSSTQAPTGSGWRVLIKKL